MFTLFHIVDIFTLKQARFIVSYWQSLLNIRYGRKEDAKGKAPVLTKWKPKGTVQKEIFRERCEKWSAPQKGWVKLNIDASFFVTTWENFSNFSGAITRDRSGRVLLSS